MPPDRPTPDLRSRAGRYLLLGIAGVVLLVVTWYFNHPLFLAINGWHGPFADAVLGVLSGLGDGLTAVVLLSALMLWRFRAGLAGLGAYLMSGLLAQILKHLHDMPRPPAVFEHVHVLGARLTAHSFPSGHATTDGTMAMLCLCMWGKGSWKAWAGVALFLIAAYGRIYGGVHFPFDVATGLMLGFGSVIACWRWTDHPAVTAWATGPWGWRGPAMLLTITAVVFGTGYHIQPSTAHVLQPVLAVAALVWVMLSRRVKRGNPRSL